MAQSLNLQQSAKIVPKDVKQLAACVDCKLVMNDTQWQKVDFHCPNCKKEKTECTKKFSGLISYIVPTHSWVAKWNGARQCVPGVYAMHVQSEEGGAGGMDYDNDENSFIVGDNEDSY